MHTAADRPAHLLQGIESIRTLAERADRNAIDRLLAQPAATCHLDEPTLDFLRRAQDLILITTQALTTALESPASSGKHGRQRGEASDTDTSPATDGQLTAQEKPLDAAEAWRRAHLCLPRHHERPIVLHVQEFESGYQAIPILVSIPDPPPVPTIETATALVIDKTTGAITRWPLLPLDVLARLYRRYRGQEPMIFDGDQ